MKTDIFDSIKDVFDGIDVFDNLPDTKLKPYIAPPRVEIQITDEIKAFIKAQLMAEMALVKKEPKPKIETKIIEKTINNPTRVVVKELIDNTAEIMKKVEAKLRKEIDNLDKSGRFGPIVVPSPIPNQSGQGGKILSTDGSNAKWIAAVGSTSSDIYTPTNVTTTRSFNAALTSLDEIASVVGSLIKSLQGAGIIQ